MPHSRPIEYVQYDTRHMRPADAFEQWRARGICGGGVVYELSGGVSDFHIVQRGHASSQVSVMNVEMSALTYERKAGQSRRDGIDWIWIECNTSVGQGRNTLTTEKGAVSDSSGDVMVTDLARTYLRQTTEARFTSACLDRSLLSEDEIEALHGSSLTGARARMMLDFFKRLRDARTEAEAQALEQRIAAVVTAVVANSADRAREAADALGPLALEQARRFIDANLSREGLEIEAVVAATNVSRPTLYRIFKPYGGLARYMWSRRLEAARLALMNPKDWRSIVSIAEAAGFSDAGHFTRAFKAEFGLRPSDLRPLAKVAA
ncbi:MAG: AraC family transcriptional regulator [Pseudomonadota bacterium]|nr:AraC family transcriptional regulator [Pseudomonadota bacterium]